MKIVYNSFDGRFSDNPRAIFEALQDRVDHEQIWLADPGHLASFPETTTIVDIRSADAVRVLEDADLLVANTHTDLEWTKSPRTTYLQTWHGTPLKRIHHDVLWAPEGRLERLDRDIARWDILLSPNAISTPRLRNAFRFEGEVLESGYPRNDVLMDPRRDLLRTHVRKKLGIDQDVTAVLYTPTWRDDEHFSEDQAKVPMALDFEELTTSLGPGFCILPRLHNMMTGRSAPARLPGVVDVSYYPDLRDLFVAADVLVTDYSSAMFDFAITGKPIVLYTYDLDRFRDSVRGFYFDLLPEAPGPMVETTTALVQALRETAATQHEYAAQRARFAETYCHLEDGQATSRVLERLGL